jgi:hypothetical protein
MVQIENALKYKLYTSIGFGLAGVSYVIFKKLFPKKFDNFNRLFVKKSIIIFANIHSNLSIKYKSLNNIINKINNKITNKINDKIINRIFNGKYKINRKMTRGLMLIKDGELVLEIEIKNPSDIKNLELISKIDDVEYDMLFYVDNNNYIRFEGLKDLLEAYIERNLHYNSNLIKFMDVQLMYEGIWYNMDLKNPNFFIENNILFDIAFMKFYCKKYLNLLFDAEAKPEYIIKILDNNCEFIELKASDASYIVLNKSDYDIIKRNKTDKDFDADIDEILGESNSPKIEDKLDEKIDEKDMDLCDDAINISIPVPKVKSNWLSLLAPFS